MPEGKINRNSEIASTLLVSDMELVGAELSELMRLVEQGVGRPSRDDSKRVPRKPLAVALGRARSLSTGGLRTYLPENIGDGYWDFIQVVPGIYTGITDAHYRSPHQLELPDETLTKIRVICEGRLHVGGEQDFMGEGSVHIHSLRPGGRLAYAIQPGGLRMVTLHLTPTGLEDLGIDSSALHEVILKESHSRSMNTPFKRIDPAVDMLRIANEIIQSRDRLPPAFRLTYVTGKSRELLAEILSALFFGTEKSATQLGVRTTRVRRRLYEAARILDATLAQPPTIDQLARLVGVNRTTLKAEFKALFGSTIHQYQSTRRMKEALRLIKETDFPIGQIAEELGFAQLSQFSTAVRRYAGSSPRELRRKQREL